MTDTGRSQILTVGDGRLGDIALAKAPVKSGDILTVTDLGECYLITSLSGNGPLHVSWSLYGQPSDAKEKPKLATVMVQLWLRGTDRKRDGLWAVPTSEGSLDVNRLVLHWGTMRPSTACAAPL